MGETDLHRKLMVDVVEAAEHYFRDQRDVYVTSDILVYYVEGDNTKFVVPDFFGVHGVEKKLRRTYRIWEERKGPEVVVEISSRSTCVEDKGNKKVIYEDLGVREYFLFDPEGNALRPPLMGYRLQAGAFRPVEPDRAPDGSLVMRSDVLGLELHGQGPNLRWVDPRTGLAIPTPQEAYGALEAEKQRAEAEKQRADVAEAELASLREELSRRRDA